MRMPPQGMRWRDANNFSRQIRLRQRLVACRTQKKSIGVATTTIRLAGGTRNAPIALLELAHTQKRRLWHDEAMKPATEMIEGPESFTRFKTALKAVLAVPKSAMPASPFKNAAPKKKKASRPKTN